MDSAGGSSSPFTSILCLLMIKLFHRSHLMINLSKLVALHDILSNSYTMGCPPVRGDNP